MKRPILTAATALCILIGAPAITANADTYTPSPEIKQAQKEFSDARFGIFLHWGIYSMMGQGEWYLNYGPNAQEYAKAAKEFATGRKVKFSKASDGVMLELDEMPDSIDYIIELDAPM